MPLQATGLVTNGMLSVFQERGSWYALATKRRQEDRAVQNLIAWGIPTLAPRVAMGGRANDWKLLFPGYIFARFDLVTTSHKMRFTRGVAYIVSFGNRPAVVADEIIAAICQRLDKNGALTLDKKLQPGDAVIITSGVLRDFQGIFEQELSDGERVRILLTTVAYTSRIQISKYELRKLCSMPASPAIACQGHAGFGVRKAG